MPGLLMLIAPCCALFVVLAFCKVSLFMHYDDTNLWGDVGCFLGDKILISIRDKRELRNNVRRGT